MPGYSRLNQVLDSSKKALGEEWSSPSVVGYGSGKGSKPVVLL